MPKAGKKSKVGKKANIRYYVVSNTRKYFDHFIERNNYTINEFYEELSEFTGVSPSTIAQIRLRNIAPSFILAEKVSQFLGVPTSLLWEIKQYDSIVERQKCEVKGCKNTAGTHNLCIQHVGMRYKNNN